MCKKTTFYFYICVPSNFAPLVTLVQRYISTGLEVSMAFLFQENWRHGLDGQTDSQMDRWRGCN